MSEEINQEFDKRDLNKDGKVTLSEKIEYAAGQAQEKLHNDVKNAMEQRSKLSNYEYIIYRKQTS